MYLRRVLLAATLSVPAFAGPVQKKGLTVPPQYQANRQEVVNMFTEAYDTYRKYAFGHDDLQPVSLTFNDGRNGWGASIVDAMSTMIIMGLDDFFNEAVTFVSKIDFSKSQVEDETVSVFETTIRYVGGLLSSFELSGSKDQILVEKAKEVADKMAFAWINGNKIPFGELNFTTNQPVIQSSNIAEAGTLDLEWSLLSKLTGNTTYESLTVGSVLQMANGPAPLPGLPAQGIDPSTNEPVGAYITWGGGSDSYFEYLIKYARFSNTDDDTFVNSWRTAVDSSIRTLLRTSTVGDFTYLADDDTGTILHVGSHLACYYGGNWLLGGQLLDNSTIVDIALKLTDSCWNTYASTPTGIGPETFAYISSDGNTTENGPITADQLDFYNKHGFYITGADYILRPEVLESNFYAWRVTGDTKYLDRAASAIKSFNEFLTINNAFSGLNDVTDTNTKDTNNRVDDTESFFFAEVMKYLFLTFDDPNHISIDNYVFNTECHPFIAPPAKSTYNPDTSWKNPSKTFAYNAGSLPLVSPAPGMRSKLKK